MSHPRCFSLAALAQLTDLLPGSLSIIINTQIVEGNLVCSSN
jgi:hypothetical protein